VLQSFNRGRTKTCKH